MAAVANNPSFAKKAGVPQSVGKEFNEADKGRKFFKGGDMKKMNMGGYADGGMAKADMKKGGIASSLKAHASAPASKAHAGMKSGGMTKLASGGSASKRADGVATKGKTKGTMVKMTKGGMAC
jgi:hypothetical protein